MYESFNVIMHMLYGMFGQNNYDNEDDIRSYFKNEYKTDSKYAYEYWRDSHKLHYYDE